MITLQQYPKIKACLALIRFEKPVGTLLLLWPAYWGLLFASDSWPHLNNVLIFTFGTFFMRSAGCAINDFADRNIDGAVDRTKNRPLARGLLQPAHAVVVAGSLALLAFLLVLMTNWLTIALSFIAVALAGLYPFAKRWIASPQLVLGAAFAWAIPMGFAAEKVSVPKEAWLYFILAVMWIVSYDTYYALADRDYDRKLNIGSTAILFGAYAAEIALALNLIFVAGFFAIAKIHFIFLILALTCSFYQYQLARYLDPAQCTRAFKLNNYTGLILTLGLLVAKL